MGAFNAVARVSGVASLTCSENVGREPSGSLTMKIVSSSNEGPLIRSFPGKGVLKNYRLTRAAGLSGRGVHNHRGRLTNHALCRDDHCKPGLIEACRRNWHSGSEGTIHSVDYSVANSKRFILFITRPRHNLTFAPKNNRLSLNTHKGYLPQ
jgi:hypothetical protein